MWPKLQSSGRSADAATVEVTLGECQDASSLPTEVPRLIAKCDPYLRRDLFLDGILFVGSAAMLTGKRYCIDGVSAAHANCSLGMHACMIRPGSVQSPPTFKRRRRWSFSLRMIQTSACLGRVA